jgi:hypothetical protein
MATNNKIVGGYGLGLIVIFILFLTIILSASYMGVFKGFEPYQQLIAAMLSVAATGVITALLLIFQRRQQEELNEKQRIFEEESTQAQREFQIKMSVNQQEFEAKQKDKEKERLKDTKIFEERLRIYQEFLRKLCDVVKDQKITPEEEIELQFQVSYIAMHTSSKTISSISEQVSDIVVNLKQGTPDANNMLMQLFSIADSFYEELYKEKNEFDPKDRENTIENFKSILVPSKLIDDYEKEQKDKVIQSYKEDGKSEKLELKERTRLLKAMISKNGAIQRIYSGTVLFHEYFTTVVDGKYVDSKDKIAIDLMPDEERKQYSVLVFTRQYDEEKTKDLVNGIWPNEEYRPWYKDSSRHVHDVISFEISNEEIKSKIEKVLQEVKAYRDKEYHLK